MTDWIGSTLRLKLFGASHAKHVGMTLSGVKSGEKIDIFQIERLLALRRPSGKRYQTARKESDEYCFESGVENLIADGNDITVTIKNNDVRAVDYENLKGIVRPGHADFAAYAKYGAQFDMAGGAFFSGRMTAPICIAGGIASGILQSRGIKVVAYLSQASDVKFASYLDENFVLPDESDAFATATDDERARAEEMLSTVAEQGDSAGGKIECIISGVEAGTGDAHFGSIESKISALAFGIPAVKAIEFGLGTEFCEKKGSMVRDEWRYDGEKAVTLTNYNGGINGGITNGMPICFRVTIKPTPSVRGECDTIDVVNKKQTTIEINGRHDAFIAQRAVPVIESIAAIALLDALEDSDAT